MTGPGVITVNVEGDAVIGKIELDRTILDRFLGILGQFRFRFIICIVIKSLDALENEIRNSCFAFPWEL